MAGLGRLADSEMVPTLDLWYLKRSGFWEILSHWRDAGERTRSFWVWGAVYFIIFFGPLFILGAWGPFYTKPDLENLTLMILNPLAWAQTVVKFTVFWMGINKQARVLNLMKHDFLRCIPENRKDHTDKILANAALFANKLVNLGVWMDVATASYWSILPIMRSEWMRESVGITMFGYTPPPGHNKILGYWFPVDVDSNPWTQVIFVYELACIFLAGFMIAIMEGLVIHLVLLFNAHTDILKFLLTDMKESNNNLDHDKLLGIVKEHIRLMEYGQDMRDLFNFMITFQMSTGLLILIITIFNFFLNTKNVDVVIMLKMIIFLLYTFVEVTVYCFVGDLMEDTSQDLGFAAYSSEWYTKGVQFRKTIQLMMVRTQSPMVLQFGRMYPINHVALMGLLQCAYSTAMFMSSMTEEQQ